MIVSVLLRVVLLSTDEQDWPLFLFNLCFWEGVSALLIRHGAVSMNCGFDFFSVCVVRVRARMECFVWLPILDVSPLGKPPSRC